MKTKERKKIPTKQFPFTCENETRERLEKLAKSYNMPMAKVIRKGIMSLSFKPQAQLEEREKEIRELYTDSLASEIKSLNRSFSSKIIQLTKSLSGQSDFILKLAESQYYLAKKYEGDTLTHDDFLIDLSKNVSGFQESALHCLQNIEGLE